MARQLVVHMLLLLTGVRYYPVITSLRHTVTPDQWYQPLTSKDVNGRATVHMAIEMHNWLQLQFLSRSVSKDHWKNLLHIRERGGRTLFTHCCAANEKRVIQRDPVVQCHLLPSFSA